MYVLFFIVAGLVAVAVIDFFVTNNKKAKKEDSEYPFDEKDLY